LDLANIGTGNDAIKMMIIDPRTGDELSHDGKPMMIEGYYNQSIEFNKARAAVFNDPKTKDLESNERNMRIIVGGIKSLDVFINGKWVKHSIKNTTALFNEYGWIYSQFVLFANEQNNFLSSLPEN